MAKRQKNQSPLLATSNPRKAGLALVSGKEYWKMLKKAGWVKKQPKTIEEIQEMLSEIKGSLGDEIVKMRRAED